MDTVSDALDTTEYICKDIKIVSNKELIKKYYLELESFDNIEGCIVEKKIFLKKKPNIETMLYSEGALHTLYVGGMVRKKEIKILKKELSADYDELIIKRLKVLK